MSELLTDTIIRNLAIKEKEYTRREKGGFGIRVHPSGRKNFFYLYRVDGQRRFLNLGEYYDSKKCRAKGNSVTLVEAREEYEKQRVKVKDLKKGHSDGEDPVKKQKNAKIARLIAEEEERNATTVSTLVNEYIEKHAKVFKRSWKADERLLNVEVVPIWDKRKAEDIKKRDIILLLESIVDRGAPAMSNQVLKIVRKMFNFAIERHILEHSPCTKVKALAPNTSRKRNLSENEIRVFWSNLDNAFISTEVKLALKLVLVTAQRPGEVSGMHTSEIQDRHWIIPPERTKNGRAHLVYLTDTALDLIATAIQYVKESKEIPAEQEYSGYIFPCPHRIKKQPIDSHALPVAVRRNINWPVTHEGKPVLDNKGKAVTENLLGVDKFTPHDLRRTATTQMAASKIIKEHRERVLNHTLEKLDGTYNLYDYLDEKQNALIKLENKLKVILAGGKVIDLDQKRMERKVA